MNRKFVPINFSLQVFFYLFVSMAGIIKLFMNASHETQQCRNTFQQPNTFALFHVNERFFHAFFSNCKCNVSFVFIWYPRVFGWICQESFFNIANSISEPQTANQKRDAFEFVCNQLKKTQWNWIKNSYANYAWMTSAASWCLSLPLSPWYFVWRTK